MMLKLFDMWLRFHILVLITQFKLSSVFHGYYFSLQNAGLSEKVLQLGHSRTTHNGLIYATLIGGNNSVVMRQWKYLYVISYDYSFTFRFCPLHNYWASVILDHHVPEDCVTWSVLVKLTGALNCSLEKSEGVIESSVCWWSLKDLHGWRSDRYQYCGTWRFWLYFSFCNFTTMVTAFI